MRRARNERGAALGIAIITALVGGIASYAMLAAAMSQARHAQFFEDRTRARYLAEAGLVIAQQRLQIDPAYAGGNELVDSDGDGAPDVTVAVTVGAPGAGGAREIRAKAALQ